MRAVGQYLFSSPTNRPTSQNKTPTTPRAAPVNTIGMFGCVWVPNTTMAKNIKTQPGIAMNRAAIAAQLLGEPILRLPTNTSGSYDSLSDAPTVVEERHVLLVATVRCPEGIPAG